GGEHQFDLVTAQPGWWRENLTTPNALCNPLREHRSACPYFVPCSPASSCLGSNECGIGYTGDRCSLCVKGAYYRVNGQCVKCPDSPWAVVILMLAAALVAIGLSWCLSKYNI